MITISGFQCTRIIKWFARFEDTEICSITIGRTFAIGEGHRLYRIIEAIVAQVVAKWWILHRSPWNVPRTALAFLNGILNGTFVLTSTL